MMLPKLVCINAKDCQTFDELFDKMLQIIMIQNNKYIVVVGGSYFQEESVKFESKKRSNPNSGSKQPYPPDTTPKTKWKRLSNL